MNKNERKVSFLLDVKELDGVKHKVIDLHISINEFLQEAVKEKMLKYKKVPRETLRKGAKVLLEK